MSDYAKLVDYAAKDALVTGNPAKLVKGTELGAEFDALVVSIATKHDVNGALGTPTSGTLTNCTGLPTAGLVDDAVTYAKVQNVSATDKVLGRSSSGAGNIEEIACTAAGRALLDDATAGDQLTTLSAAGTALSNVFTGANKFRNAAGIRSEQADTQDAIAIVGRAGGSNSYEATITPTTLSADITVTIPDASGTLAYTETGTVTAGGIALTFTTPGNLSVTYGTRDVTWTKTGNRYTLRGYITASVFTHTTASGQYRITGALPAAPAKDAIGVAAVDGCAGLSGGILVYATAGQTFLDIYYTAAGVLGGAAVGNVPTGSAKAVWFNLTYEV